MRPWIVLGLLPFAPWGCDSCGGRDQPPAATAGPRCTAEITAGKGTHRVSRALGKGQTEEALRKELFAEACAALCQADGATGEALAACQARCQVDITAEKVGARFSCE